MSGVGGASGGGTGATDATDATDAMGLAGSTGAAGASAVLRRTGALAWTGFLQLVRSRVYLNILVAGIALVVASLLFDRLSAGHEGRVLIDVGTAFISLIVAALAGTIAITAVTRDLETKQAHLILARPITRTEFVFARFLTTGLLVVVSNVVLGALLAALIAGIGADHALFAFGAVVFASFEGLIIAAFAVFFGVGSSSTMSAVFTATLFILGRLTAEMQGVIERGVFGGATGVLTVIHRALPHLPAFDLTPFLHGEGTVTASGLVGTAVYGLAYSLVFLAGASLRFSRRDLL